MNPDTNELIQFDDDELNKLFKKHNPYEQLPDDLHHAAKVKLKGRKSAFVSKTSGGKLSKWAVHRRKEKRLEKRKNQAEMVKRCNEYYKNK